MRDDLPLKTILEHLTAMESRMCERLEPRFENLESRMGGIERRMTGLEDRMSRLEQTSAAGFAQVNSQLDAIDHRLDELEIETLPKRVKALEKAILA